MTGYRHAERQPQRQGMSGDESGDLTAPVRRADQQLPAEGRQEMLRELRRVLVPRILDDPIELDESKLIGLRRVRIRAAGMGAAPVCRSGRALQTELREALNEVARELGPRSLVGRLAEGLASGLSQTMIAESAGVTAPHLSRRKAVLARLVLGCLLAEGVHDLTGELRSEAGRPIAASMESTDRSSPYQAGSAKPAAGAVGNDDWPRG